ncbi:CPBP family intramembrane glutamic endopeptidase [Nocardia vulneris]|uniref:CPBP family intramembrane glutamic endopeptidase n=1 Tax=Nocardia vulneris TaxID=1141657 RepID=UPI0014355E40|nr:CPBP family intramembrane glutamic endopeptidase [Nocardia vulneris]
MALTWRDGGGVAVMALLRRVVDRPAARLRWYAAAALMVPAIGVVSHLVLWCAGRVDTAAPLSLTSAVPIGLVLFMVGAAFEELGWTAYATDPLQRRFGPIATGLGMGLYWAVWHLVGWVQAGHSALWVAGWFLATVAARVLIVDLYNRTGGVSAAILLHTMLNVVAANSPELNTATGTITFGILTTVVALGFILRSPALQPHSMPTPFARR